MPDLLHVAWSTLRSEFAAVPGGVLGLARERAGKAAGLRNLYEAIAFHLDGLRDEGQPIPEPTTSAAFVDVV